LAGGYRFGAVARICAVGKGGGVIALGGVGVLDGSGVSVGVGVLVGVAVSVAVAVLVAVAVTVSVGTVVACSVAVPVEVAASVAVAVAVTVLVVVAVAVLVGRAMNVCVICPARRVASRSNASVTVGDDSADPLGGVAVASLPSSSARTTARLSKNTIGMARRRGEVTRPDAAHRCP
jgi:hypothetical protein